MTKVLMVGSASSVKGGITSVISQILKYDWKKEQIEMDFVPTYINKNPILKLCFFIRALIMILFRLWLKKPDVVYIHMSYKGSFTRKYVIHRICKLFKVKDAIHLHGSEFEKWYNESKESIQNKIRKLLCECDTMIVLGEEWEKKVLAIEKDTKTEIIKNTVAIPEVGVAWNTEKFNVLFLGVLIKRKGVSDLIDAVSLLKSSNKIKNLHFCIAGSGDEEVFLKKKVNDNNLEEFVEFVGWIDDEKKTKLLENSQALVLPSYNEGLPVAVLEAISYGMPIIATDVGDMKMAVKEGYNGFIINPGDADALAEALFKINNKELFDIMSENSKSLAKENFSDETYFSRLAKIFNDVNVR